VTDPLANALTEQQNPASARLDTMSALEIVDLMNQQDRLVTDAVHAAREAIAEAVEIIVAALRGGGRLFYIGAGTSGRLGVLDASECPPTFGTDPMLVQGLIAGGRDALVTAIEGAEDRPEGGAEALHDRAFAEQDVLVGIAACGVTPFVKGGLDEARRLGARTIFVTCNPGVEGLPGADVMIGAAVGPEVLTGSTRLKAGTATKLILNTLTTATMVRLGKCYGNLMVDLRCTNHKLLLRSVRMLGQLCDLDEEAARHTLDAAGAELKVAIVMARRRVKRAEAVAMLEQYGGILRGALGEA